MDSIPITDLMGRTPKPALPKLAPLRYEPFPDGAKKVAELPPVDAATLEERIAPYRRILEDHQAAKVAWVARDGRRRSMLFDALTAAAIVRVLEALPEDKRLRTIQLEPPALASLCLRCLG